MTEYFSQLYGTEVPFKNQALDSLNQMPVADHLDNHPILSEVISVLRSIKPGKAPHSDGIPPAVLKLDIPPLTSEIHYIICLCWEESIIPQDMMDAQFITLPKNKGSRLDCNPLSRDLPFSAWLMNFWESHPGQNLGTSRQSVCWRSLWFQKEQINNLHGIHSNNFQENCIEQHRWLYIMCTGLTMASDTVSRTGLYKDLEKIGCPPKLLQMIYAFHDWMTTRVIPDENISEPLNLGCGVKQGCVMTPILCGIYWSTLLYHAFPSPDGIALHTRQWKPVQFCSLESENKDQYSLDSWADVC